MDNEINNVMNYFPDVELSYEKKIYKKVYNYDYYLAIPHGVKYFAWFKSFCNKNKVYIMELNTKKKSILNIKKYSACFSNDLCIKDGTIIYGTILNQYGLKMFSIEDIFYAFGKNLNNTNNKKKLEIIKNILDNHLKQKNFYNNNIIFGLPLITRNKNDLSNIIHNCPYKIWSIKYKNFDNNYVFYEKTSSFNVFANFLVEADIQPDIYNLYILKNHKQTFFKKSIISNFKNSVKMNSIFRNIKENTNLDLLEESDDEDEFENLNLDKYLLNKKKIMKCKYNSKFKLWEPIELIDSKISMLDDVIKIEKNL